MAGPCCRHTSLWNVIGAALTLINLDTNRWPDGILLPSYPIVLVLLLVATMVTGPALFRAVLVGSVLLVGFFVLAASRGQWTSHA